MNKRQLLFLLVLSLVPFFFHAFIEVPLGGDAPYFFAVSCEQNVNLVPIPFLSLLFFQFLPCDLLVFKFVSVLAMFFSAIIVAKTGELFSQKHGWLAGAFLFFSVAFVHGLIQIEDDILGFPFLLLANYFFIKSGVENNRLVSLIAVVLVGFTGFFLWKGALVYLFSYGFFSSMALIMFYLVLINIGFGSIEALLGNSVVLENLNALTGGGLGLGHGIALFGLYFLPKAFSEKRFRPLLLGVPFFVVGLLNVKFMLHSSAFLALGLMFLVEGFEKKKAWFKQDFGTRNFVSICLVLVLVMVFALGAGFFFQAPYSNQLLAVKETVSLASKNKCSVSNDWSYGYWIRFFGGVPDNEGGGGIESNLVFDGLVLTEQPVENCVIIKNYGKGFNYDLVLWDCRKILLS